MGAEYIQGRAGPYPLTGMNLWYEQQPYLRQKECIECNGEEDSPDSVLCVSRIVFLICTPVFLLM